MKSQSKYNNFYIWKCASKCCLYNGRHFSSASMCKIQSLFWPLVLLWSLTRTCEFLLLRTEKTVLTDCSFPGKFVIFIFKKNFCHYLRKALLFVGVVLSLCILFFFQLCVTQLCVCLLLITYYYIFTFPWWIQPITDNPLLFLYSTLKWLNLFSWRKNRLYGPRCPLSRERLLNLITHSLTHSWRKSDTSSAWLTWPQVEPGHQQEASMMNFI